MTPDDWIHVGQKSLEVWTLQNVADLAIILGFVALGLLLAQRYFDRLERLLSLRVGLELWRLLTRVAVDLTLFLAILMGFVTINPDVMVDIKVAVPFFPLAVVAWSAALVLRVLYGGDEPGRAGAAANLLVALAAVLNWFGYTFVMEAPGSEWLERHPSAAWTALRGMRSNVNLELGMVTFWVCNLALIAIMVWAVFAAWGRTGRAERQGAER